MTDAPTPPNEDLARVQALLNASRQLATAGNAKEALDKASEARALAWRLPEDGKGTHELRAASAQELGVLYQRLNDATRALEYYAAAEESVRRLPPSSQSRLLLAATLINKGGLLTRQRVFDEALATLTEAVAELEGAGDGSAGAVAVMMLSALQSKSAVELERRAFEAARSTLSRALELGETVASTAPQLLPQVVDTAGRLIQVAKVVSDAGLAIQTAERAGRWAEAAHRAGSPLGPQLYVTTRFQLVDAHVFAGALAEAESHLWKALDLASTPQTLMLGCDFYFTLLRCTEAQLEAGDLPRAELVEALSEVLEKMEAGSAPEGLMELVRGRFAVLSEGRVDVGEKIVEETSGVQEPVLQQLRLALKSDVDWRIKSAAGS